MIGSRSCVRGIRSEAGIRSTTSETAFFAVENLRDGRWTFAVCPEENSSCVVPRWDACLRRISGVMRRRLLLIWLKSIGVTVRLTNGDVACLNQHCECRLVAYDWGHSRSTRGSIGAG